MFLLILSLFSAGIVVLDQVVKFLVVQNIPLHGEMPLLPGIVQLTYIQNTGAAFSILEGQHWFFTLVFLLFAGALLWAYFTKSFALSRFDWFCLASIFGGGLGNMIDRIRLGYVVDMIETQFIRFPVFNVADCFITCGCIALIISMAFLNKDFWKDEKK